MLNETRRLITEIVLLVILLIIVVPICINKSNEYKNKKDVLLNGTNTTVDITYTGDMKKLTIYSNNDVPVRVNLVLKISKLLNDYEIMLGDSIYKLNDLDVIDDDEYCYYNLGFYEVDEIKELDFKIMVVGDEYYEETITYCFLTEGLFSENARL